MRVTNKMIAGTLTKNIQSSMGNLARTQEQLSTGLRIIRPSDDPSMISPLLGVKATKQANEQYVRNIDDGLAYLNMTDAVLGTVGEVVTKAKEYTVQAANDTYEADDRAALAEQIDKMIDQLVDLGNSTLGSKYLFAGMKNDQPPFKRVNGEDGAVEITYFGDTQRITREILSKASYEVDAPGVTESTELEGVFGHLVSGKVEDGIFQTMITLRDNLRNDDTDGLQTSLEELDRQLNHILRHRVGVGARTNHLDSVKEQLLDQEIRLTAVEDTMESADIAKVSIDMGQQMLAYQASLSSGAMLLQTSLVNFLK